MFFQQFRELYDIFRKIVVKSTLAEDVDIYIYIYIYGHFSGYNIVVSCACAATHNKTIKLFLPFFASHMTISFYCFYMRHCDVFLVDVTELIRPSLFSPDHDFKNVKFNFELKYLWKYLSVRGMVYGEFLEKMVIMSYVL